MKTLKALTVAVVASAALAFCATSARAVLPPTTSQSSPVNISMTLSTNGFAITSTGFKATIVSHKFANKDLLNLLTNSDFAGVPFPTGSKLVIGWDWGGDLLVVDKSGSNVLYDATLGTGGNSVAINFYYQEGAISYNANFSTNSGGNINATWYNNASFTLTDTDSSINLAANGPCTERFTYKKFIPDSSIPVWTDSQDFTMSGANELTNIAPPFTGTLSGSIKANGSGKNFTFQFEQILGKFPPAP